jgi:hypothetical protein
MAHLALPAGCALRRIEHQTCVSHLLPSRVVLAWSGRIRAPRDLAGIPLLAYICIFRHQDLQLCVLLFWVYFELKWQTQPSTLLLQLLFAISLG